MRNQSSAAQFRRLQPPRNTERDERFRVNFLPVLGQRNHAHFAAKKPKRIVVIFYIYGPDPYL